MGDAHVGLSKIVWGDSDTGKRVDLQNPLPINFAGQTGSIAVDAKVTGITGGNVPVSNYVENLPSSSYGQEGYGTVQRGKGTHFIAVAGNTSGVGYAAYVAITGSVQGIPNPEDAHPIAVTGGIDLRGSMARERVLYDDGGTAQGILVQGVHAGTTATVAGEVFPGYGFGVPIAVTAGRRMSALTDSITVTGSVVMDGGRELSSATDSVRVFGYDGLNSVRSVLMPDPTTGTTAGWTSGYPGGPVDTLQVALMNAGQGISFSVQLSENVGIYNSNANPIRVQGATASSPADPVIVRGENAGALEIYSSSGLNTQVTNQVDILDTNIISSLEDLGGGADLSGIKDGTDMLPTIREDIVTGNITASISEIQKPTTLRAWRGIATDQAKVLHQNAEIKSGVTIKYVSGTGAEILIGGKTLSVSDGNGYLLGEGETIFLEINNLNKIYIKTTAADNTAVVTYIGS